MPVVVTEYQSCPSADLSRATTRAQRGSSVTWGGTVMNFVAVWVLFVMVVFFYWDGSGSTVPPIRSRHTPFLAFKSVLPLGGYVFAGRV